MIYLNKILPNLIYPITIVIALLIIGILRKEKKWLIGATALLLITSNPYLSNQLAQHLENNNPKKLTSDINNADAVVVLGGMLTPIQTNKGIAFEWSDSDRFFGGIELMKARKANILIFTGGKLPWQKNNETEGYILGKYAENFGISSSTIQITREVQSTQDEALAVKELLAPKKRNKIILVTSAFHMPRAKYLFEKQNFEVQTYPVDYRVPANNITILDFLPSAAAMKSFEFSIRELLGRVYYQLKDQ